MTFKLNVASISDIHLGHRQTPTRHILDNLYRTFPDNEETGLLDIIFIVGDLFDGPLGYYSDEAVQIQFWMRDFLQMCYKRDICVRVLEGTRSHDWRQNIWFNVVADIAHLKTDVKYVSELSIEHIDRFNIDILYVPDEWRPETDQTWLEVNQLLAQHQLKQVDFTLLHGAFAEQLVPQATCPKHISERYQSITRRHVFAGHIHQRWSNGNILGNGSFDRLTHGDEGKKGHWRVSYRDDAFKAKFIENVNAMTFMTIACHDLSIEDALTLIDAKVKDLREHSRVRISANEKDAIVSAMDQLRKQYPKIVWSVQVMDKLNSQASLMVDVRPVSKSVPITAQNARQLIEERLALQNVSKQLMHACLANLDELGVV